MAKLKLNHIYKVYNNNVKAVNDFNLDIKDNEFIVFVGPSGCGKSTTLRMIAGLEDITSGELFIDDVLVNSLEPKERDIAFVFQNYALYPHMTVYDNMAYGLKNQKIPKDIINQKVLEAAEMLDITPYLDRLPKEMSGGQRQRVALGRALVRNPKVFLLDEPLSNLDAKLRTQMRSEITKLHNKIKTTFIYVTHDQTEAMTMGSRIVVMKDGYIQQIDTPISLYNNPSNKFVAGFIGTPQMNFYNIVLSHNKDSLLLSFDEDNSLEIPYIDVCKISPDYFNKQVSIGCRPEHVIISDKGLKCNVTVIEQLGTESILYGDIKLKDSVAPVICKIPFDSNIKVNDTIYIAFDSKHLHFFDIETENSISKNIPNEYSFNTVIENNSINLFGQAIPLPSCMNLQNGEYEVIIPSNALCDGNDFSLKDIDFENNIARIKFNEKYYHFTINSEAKPTSFSLKFEKLTFKKNNKIVIKPINEEIILSGFIKREGKKGSLKYYFDIENNTIDPNYEKIQKVASIDGINCHKIEYQFKLNNSDLIISNKGIKAEIVNVLDYKNTKYLEILINNKRFYINKDLENKTKEIYLALDFDKVTIINPTTGLIVA